MTATLNHVVPSVRRAAAVENSAGADSSHTVLELSSRMDSKQIATLIMFLHSSGIDEVSFEPRADGRYEFALTIAPETLLTAFLDSNEVRPHSIRSFASGRLEVSL